MKYECLKLEKRRIIDVELRKQVAKLQQTILETRWSGVIHMANETATMFASETEMLTDWKRFVRNLG